MSVAFALYLMCKVLFYMRIVYDASGMNVCMYVYSGVCTPRVGGAWRVLSTSRSKPRIPPPPPQSPTRLSEVVADEQV